MLTSINVKKLPDAFKKTQDSNNAKMLAINENAVSKLNTVFEQLDESLDIYKAYGKTLDLYGDSVGQKRGGMNDDQFRLMILSRIAVNTSGVDYQTIIDNIIRILGLNEEDIEMLNIREREEPATIELTAFPYELLGRAGFTSKQAVELIGRLIPICVTLVAREMQGTFQFASEPTLVTEYDEKKGFANLEQTIGGTLGMLVGEDEDGTPLPIND